MCLTVSHCCLLSLTIVMPVSHCLLWLLAVPHCLSGPIEFLHVSHWCWPSLTVSLSATELLHVFLCLFQFH